MSYVTANFLHTGWLHLIGNMWLLWLAGAILEDTWAASSIPSSIWRPGRRRCNFMPG